MIMNRFKVLSIVILIACTGGGYWYGYTSGTDAIHRENAEALREAKAKAIAEQRKIWKVEKQVLKQRLEREEKLASRLKEVEQRVKTVESPDCTSISPEWLRLRNEAASAVRESMRAD